MIKLKKTALAILTFSMASTAFSAMYEAPPAQEKKKAKNGFYVGVGVGGISFATDIVAQGSGENTLFSTISSGNTLNANTDDGNISVNGDLLLGYGWTFSNKMFLGAEVFGNLFNSGAASNITTVNDLGPGEFTLKASDDLTYRYAYGIRALPGYRMAENVVIYGIVGFARAHASTTGSVSVYDAFGDFAEQPVSDHVNFNGYQLGVGSMINMTEHLLLRGDLIYTGYSVQTLYSQSWTDVTSFVTGSNQISVTGDPSSLEADVSLVYMFD